MYPQYKVYSKAGWGDRVQSLMKHRDHIFTGSCQVSLIYHRNMPSELAPLSSVSKIDRHVCRPQSALDKRVINLRCLHLPPPAK